MESWDTLLTFTKTKTVANNVPREKMLIRQAYEH